MASIFTNKHLNKLFPFHLLITDELTIVQSGKLVNKLVPVALKGQPLAKHFTIRGIKGELCFGALLESCDKPVSLESVNGEIILKGAFYESASPKQLVFLGNIEPDFLNEGDDRIKRKDFPAHDAFGEYLFDRNVTTCKDKAGLKKIKQLEKAFIEDEINYRTLLNHMHEGILQVDNQEIIRYVNDRFCEMLGYKREELLDQNAIDLLLLNKEDETGMKSKSNERANKKKGSYEITCRKKNGDPIWLSVSAAPLIDQVGKVVGSVGINTDISESKHVLAELNESEQRYQKFIANSREGIWRLEYNPPLKIAKVSSDKLARQVLYDGTILECNKEMARMYGFKNAEELHGTRLIDLYAPKTTKEKNSATKRATAFIKNNFTSDEAISKERDKNGNNIYVLNSTTGEVENGYLIRLWGVQKDVTQEVITNKALEESELRYRSLFEKMSDGLLLTDTKGVILMANPSFCKLTGYSSTKLAGMKDQDLMFDTNTRGPSRRNPRKSSRGKAGKHELYLLTKSNKKIHVQVSDVPYFSRKDELAGVMSIITDTTVMKNAEIELRDSEHKYRSIFEQSYQAVYDFDVATKEVLHANKSFLKYLGYEKSDLEGLKIYEFINHNKASIDKLVDNITKERTVAIGEREWKKKNGDVIDVMVMGSLIQQQSKTFVNIVAEDVTERKRTQARKDLSYNIANAATKYSHDFNEFSRHVHEKLNSYMGADICQLTLYDQSKGVLDTICVRDEAVDISNFQNSFGNGLQEYTIVTGKSLLLNQSEFDEFTKKTGYEVSIHNQNIKPKVLLLVPLLRTSGVVGVITIASTRSAKDLVPDDIELMKFVATQISTVLEQQEAHHEVQKAQRTIEQSMNAVLTTDLEGNVVYANPAAGDMWGYPDASTMMAHKPHLFNYYPLDTHPMLHSVIRITKTEGRYFNSDGLNCVKKDNTSFIAQIGASSVKNEMGETIGLTFSCIDITELKKTEKDYDRLLGTMSEGVIEVDNNEKIIYVNQRFCSLAGYTREELINQNANELLVVDSENSAEMKRKATRRKKGARETYETQLKKKNGEIVWVYTSAAPVMGEHGSVIGSVGIMTDISQRKLDEDKLESLSRFPGENPFPVLRYSVAEDQFSYSNSSGALIVKFLKLKKNKATFQDWKTILHDAYKNFTMLTDEFKINDQVFVVNFVPVLKEKYVNIYASDITDRKKMEDKMTWQFMKLEKYAFVTSHQLRRPIATMLGLVNIFDYDNIDAAFNLEVLEKFKIVAQEMDAVTRETVELLVEDEFLDEE